MVSNCSQPSFHTCKVFDLASASHEIRGYEEAQYLLDTSGVDHFMLQVWVGAKTLTLEPPIAGLETFEVTAWEHHLYGWLTEQGMIPGETAYLVWNQGAAGPGFPTAKPAPVDVELRAA